MVLKTRLILGVHTVPAENTSAWRRACRLFGGHEDCNRDAPNQKQTTISRALEQLPSEEPENFKPGT